MHLDYFRYFNSTALTILDSYDANFWPGQTDHLAKCLYGTWTGDCWALRWVTEQAPGQVLSLTVTGWANSPLTHYHSYANRQLINTCLWRHILSKENVRHEWKLKRKSTIFPTVQISRYSGHRSKLVSWWRIFTAEISGQSLAFPGPKSKSRVWRFQNAQKMLIDQVNACVLQFFLVRVWCDKSVYQTRH